MLHNMVDIKVIFIGIEKVYTFGVRTVTVLARISKTMPSVARTLGIECFVDGEVV
jgi:hypothetical protein